MTTNPRKWPFPGDAVLVRARKVAWAYRAVVEEIAPARCKELDEKFTEWGEHWHCSQIAPYDGNDLLPTIEAASLIGITSGSLSNLRVVGRIKGYKRRDRGRGFAYKVNDLLELSTQIRNRRVGWHGANSADKVPAAGEVSPPPDAPMRSP